jgi:hypothetical protein
VGSEDDIFQREELVAFGEWFWVHHAADGSASECFVLQEKEEELTLNSLRRS